MVGRGGNKKREREREFGIEWNAQRIVIRCEEEKKKERKERGEKIWSRAQEGNSNSNEVILTLKGNIRV